MDVIEQYSNDVLAYGYFTTDDLTTATLIANSTFNYHKLPPTMYYAHQPTTIPEPILMFHAFPATTKWF